MRSTISLDARIFDSGKHPPVAPPRRKTRTTLKKGSTLPTSFSERKVKNGFRDVFGNNSVNSYDEIEYINKDENSLVDTISQMTSTPEKKLRVGNKKSDKFFGEELSDRLSDEPVTPAREQEDEEIDAAKSETDKKLSFFLMNMLDDIRDQVEEDKYRGREPIEEPLFVKRKKITKHICDDDDDTHKHGHCKEKVAPPKPDRDFSKFKIDSIEEQIEKEVKMDNNVQTKVVIRRGISRENLPSPPETPRRKTGNAPTITIETIELNMTERRDDLEDFKKSNESIKEQIESNSHKITNLVDEMIKKAYGIGGFNPEDCSHHTHDELVAPTSKLSVRKISTGRKNSTESSPSIESETIVKTDNPPKVTQQKEDRSKMDHLVEESHRKFYEIDEAARVPKTHVRLYNDDQVIAATTMNDIIDEIYSRNSEIMKEFQSFLEQSIEEDPVIDVEEEKKFVDRKEVMENFTAQIVAENEELLDDELENRRYSDSFESTDEEQHDIAKRKAFEQAAKKRSSIKDCDNWFSHHVEREETESDVCNNVRDLERPPSGYDHKKIFPFGTTITGRRDSLSDEFFSDLTNTPLKLAISTVRESESSVSEEEGTKDDELKALEDRSEGSPDHSVLFKYIDKSANESIMVDDKK